MTSASVYPTSFAVGLMVLISIGCCANCMQPVGARPPQGYAPGNYSSGGGNATGSGYGRMPPPASNVGPWDPYSIPPQRSYSEPSQPLFGGSTPSNPGQRSSGLFGFGSPNPQNSGLGSFGFGNGNSGLGSPSLGSPSLGRAGSGFGTANPMPTPNLPSLSNPSRIYTPPGNASIPDWNPFGIQPPTLRTPGFRDTRWPF